MCFRTKAVNDNLFEKSVKSVNENLFERTVNDNLLKKKNGQFGTGGRGSPDTSAGRGTRAGIAADGHPAGTPVRWCRSRIRSAPRGPGAKKNWRSGSKTKFCRILENRAAIAPPAHIDPSAPETIK